MTFEQFQATRRHCDDLGKAVDDGRWEGQPAAKGNLYLGCLFIESAQPHWPQEARDEGKWYLVLERDEWITDDLESLERKLYQWAESAGYFDTPVEGGALPSTDELCAEYKAWNKANGLDLGSADEHLWDANLTAEQRRWLATFSQRWEIAQRAEDEAVRK